MTSEIMVAAKVHNDGDIDLTPDKPASVMMTAKKADGSLMMFGVLRECFPANPMPASISTAICTTTFIRSKPDPDSEEVMTHAGGG